MIIKIGDVVIDPKDKISDVLIKRYIHKKLHNDYEFTCWYISGVINDSDLQIMFFRDIMYTDIFREFSKKDLKNK